MAQPIDHVHWWNLRSLRLHTVLVVCLVAVAPAAWIWGGGVVDHTLRIRRSVDVHGVARGIVDDASDPQALARRSNVRIRAWDDRGELLFDHDGRRPGPIERWDPTDDSVTLAAFEQTLPPPLERSLVRDASGEPRTECRSNPELTLWVCESVVRAHGKTWLVQRTSERAMRSLYELRWRFGVLSLAAALLALLLGGWIAWRWIRPVTELRNAALARVDRPLAAPPLNLQRQDELGELAAAFDALLEAVRDQARAHETFVGDLAHEMKNPVAAIRAVAESLDGAEELGPERVERVARILTRSTDRLQRVLAELLDLARAEAGLPGDERQVVDLAELVRGVTEPTEAQSAPVSMVPERMEALVRNLVDNAHGFAGPGGQIEVRVLAEADHAVLIVSDDGPGIAADQLARVFDRFFTTRGQGPGTGVGLALVKAVAEAHGGTVSVVSEPGQGATFTVRLPRS